MTTPIFHAKSTALEVVKGLNANLEGKVVLLTGGTSGKEKNIRRIMMKSICILIL